MCDEGEMEGWHAKLCERRRRRSTTAGNVSLRNIKDVTILKAFVCLLLKTKATPRDGSKGLAVGRITLW